MGVRIDRIRTGRGRLGQTSVGLCLLACAGCGVTSAVAPATPDASGQSLEVATEPQWESPTPYVNADSDLADLASQFVRRVLTYDACAHDRTTSLDRVAPWVTEPELQRLHRSERAHLQWWVLCQRNERAVVLVDGISEETGSPSHKILRVEALRTTRSDLSTVREFVQITLQVVRTPDGWRVDGAEGGGL